jgi:hypothetical protein
MADVAVQLEGNTLVETRKNVAVLSGAEDLLKGDPRFSLSISLSSSLGPSTLMIPDATGVATGAPIYITKPIGIEGRKLKTFLAGGTKKKPEDPDPTPRAKLPEPLAKLVDDATISCQAFYYSNKVMLLMFELKFTEGVLDSLIGEGMKDLFDIKGASIRILKSTEEQFPILQRYADDLLG